MNVILQAISVGPNYYWRARVFIGDCEKMVIMSPVDSQYPTPDSAIQVGRMVLAGFLPDANVECK